MHAGPGAGRRAAAPRARRRPPSATAPAAISGPRCGGGRRSSRRPPAKLIAAQPIGSSAVSDLVITEDREAVRHVVLNRPEKRNALNEDLVLAIGAALRAAADDPSVRCVVLRGNGPVFSAGMDVAALAGAASAPERLRTFRRACLEAWNLAEEMTKPVVCADPRRLPRRRAGARAGLRPARARPRTPYVGLPETRLGLVPDLGGSSRLPQVVGVGRAKELIMTGRVIGAADAERFGLANRVAPPTLDAATAELVGELLGVRADRGRAGQAPDRRLGPPRAVDDAGARGRRAGAVRALGGRPRGRARRRRAARAELPGPLDGLR